MSQNNNNDDIPEDLKRILRVEYTNGFGFQNPFKSRIMLGWINGADDEDFDRNAFVDLLKSVTSSETIGVDDYIGRDYLFIDCKEFEKIQVVIQACLDNNMPILLGNRVSVRFNPDETFSRRNMELKIIEWFDHQMKMYSLDNRSHSESTIIDSIFRYGLNGVDNLLDPWNWSIPEGKALCAKLRRLRRLPEIPEESPRYLWDVYEATCKKYGVYHHSNWGKYEPSMLTVNDLILNNNNNNNNLSDSSSNNNSSDSNNNSNNNSRKKAKITDRVDLNFNNDFDEIEKELNESCMICYENKPNTMVLPCMHVVVCKECSIGLRNTNDRRTCVQCRRPITAILEE